MEALHDIISAIIGACLMAVFLEAGRNGLKIPRRVVAWFRELHPYQRAISRAVVPIFADHDEWVGMSNGQFKRRDYKMMARVYVSHVTLDFPRGSRTFDPGSRGYRAAHHLLKAKENRAKKERLKRDLIVLRQLSSPDQEQAVD